MRAFFDRVAHQHQAVFGAWDSAVDHDNALFFIDSHHLQILRGNAALAHMTRHFFAFEYAARILALAGRTCRTMRHRYAVRCFETCEVPALHNTGEAFTHRGAYHINELARNKVSGGDFRAYI